MAIVLILKSLMMFLSQQLLLVVLVSAEELKCPSSFDCGYLGEIKFPFTTTLQPHCGLLAIDGCQQNDSYASRTLQLNNPTPTSYSVLQVEPRTIIIRDDRQYHYLQTKNCTAFANNFSLPQTSSLASFYLKYNITIFRCNRSLNTTPPQHFYKYSNCSDYDIFYGPPNTQIPPGFKWPSSLTPCSTVQLAVEANSTNNPFQFLSASIAIEVRLSDTCESCLNRGEGQCLLDSRGNFYCTKENKSLAWKLGLGIGLPAIIIIGLLISIWYCKPRCVSYFYSNANQESASIYFGVPVFTYKDLEKATKRFDRSRELGEGGFGIVYYGKLDDGREVAVKRLHEHSYRRLEQFMNEIKILTRLRHQNLVSLYGCTSRHSRELVLVYEYISNGTVASHLHHHGSTNRAFLPWPIRIKVAIETATALAYLHSSDIIHRDVKTNNILLDNTYCVKVADFGLSRLFPNDVTHVSTAPQGTPGYVDPEYHRCYQLTNKSDVYSFGVVLIELISSMPAIDLSRHHDEINLADLAIRKIQKGEIAQLVDPSLSFDSNSDVKSQITSVAELAFQCLQRDRELRPSMDEILEVLRRIESWKDESGHLKELNFHRSNPLSPDHVEMKLLRNMKMISSPKAVTDKWNSDSTSPIVSGQSPNKI